MTAAAAGMAAMASGLQAASSGGGGGRLAAPWKVQQGGSLQAAASRSAAPWKAQPGCLVPLQVQRSGSGGDHLRLRSSPLIMSGRRFRLRSARACAAAAELPASPRKTIWLSNIAPLWQKPYFRNRSWSPTDVGIALYLIATHLACLLAPFNFTWKAFGVFLATYVMTGMLGITLSFHRNLSHRSFVLPKWLEYTFAYFGLLALQGDPLEWVSSHRYHHQHCDTEMDPHSPFGGFWFSHVGWVMDSNKMSKKVGTRSNVADLAKQPFYQFMQKTYPLHGFLFSYILYAWGGLPFLIWGVYVRAAWVYHITWLVNSACHVWGYQSWKTGDLSKNNWWVAILAFGEGWHNNHHAFEYSARHGLEWWQLDLTWYFILALEKLGLATNVKLPTKEQMCKMALDTENCVS